MAETRRVFWVRLTGLWLVGFALLGAANGLLADPLLSGGPGGPVLSAPGEAEWALMAHGSGGTRLLRPAGASDTAGLPPEIPLPALAMRLHAPGGLASALREGPRLVWRRHQGSDVELTI